MKKTSFVYFLVLFFLCEFIFSLSFLFSHKTASASFVRSNQIECDGKTFEFNNDEILKDIKPTIVQNKLIKNDTKSAIETLKKMGLNNKEIAIYLCPESSLILEKLKKAINKAPVSNEIKVKRNTCEIVFIEGKSGKYIDEVDYYNKILKRLENNKKSQKIKLSAKTYNQNEFKKTDFQEKSCFSTNFSTSGEERKNNIRLALSAFDGLILEDGEIMSFNSVTGERNENNGYKKAKIISNGTFTQGFGGGVCQVSTTIYNACLLAGLEIVEVHSHSLPVSYIEPSFDAMVNTGSSDLVIRNNSGGRIIFTTSYEGDKSKVKIFGIPNSYKITRQSEKTKIISASPDEITTDCNKFNIKDLQIGEEKRLSYAKDGYESNAYLKYYDKNGNIVKTTKIRSNKYNPTRGVIVRREN